jgi:hypothetical protein
MGVLIEGISVVVRRDAIAGKFPGGLAGYQTDCPNASFCADEELTRVGFMSPYDVQRWVTALGQYGITFVHENRCVDLSVVDQVHGPTALCDWLEFGRQPEGYLVAWLKGTIPHEVAVPLGWQPESSLSTSGRYVPSEKIKAELAYEGREGDVDTFIDPKTGQKYSMGRPAWKD